MFDILCAIIVLRWILMTVNYDSKIEQTCKICGDKFPHNKSGKFTSHLKQGHNLSLNEYLESYYYTVEDMTCSTETCNNKVSLRRGIPNKFCSKGCGKAVIKVCENCGKKFRQRWNDQRNCSYECGRKSANIKVKEWHSKMTDREKKAHFENIISKTARTRKENGTPSWNSGKVGVYSEETIEKIRTAALRQLEDGKFKKTSIEIAVEDILKELKLNYKYSSILEKRQYDFILPDYNILIECDGDFWHCNPLIYPNPSEFQLERIKIDKLKNNIAERNGYRLLRVWEWDINNNIETVKESLKSILDSTPQRSWKRQA